MLADLVAHVKEFTKGGEVVLPENVVYVGRRNNRRGLAASPLANPFDWSYIPAGLRHTDAGTEQLLLWYRRWIGGLAEKDRVVATQAELARLRALHERHGELVLVCWCAPKPCHADVIAEALEAQG